MEDYLLQNACASIKYRIKQEVTKNISNNEEENLLSEIMEDDLVQEIIKNQNKDGWIEADFHSEKGVETAIRVLSQKGINKDNIVQANMLKELKKRENTFDDGCLSRVGKVLDKKGFGGSHLMRATVFAYAGEENEEFVKREVKNALKKFAYVCNFSGLEEVIRPYRNKSVFREDVLWPSIYDLRILAYTYGWRNKENIELLACAVKKLIELSPIPLINVLHKSQLISPGSFCMHNFKPDFVEMTDKEWMMWFHRMELLSRIGIVNHIKELKEQVIHLIELLKTNDGLYIKRVTHNYFMKWGTYTGLALERDWRIQKRRVCDLTFRSLLILHYSQVDN